MIISYVYLIIYLQIELSEKRDANFERIAEENRWWADTANNLQFATEQMKNANEMKSTDLIVAQKELSQRKEAAVQASYHLSEKEYTIKNILCKIKEIQDKRKADAERKVRLLHLNNISRGLEENLIEVEENLMKSVIQIKENEERIKVQEEKLSSEILFGEQLSEFVDRGQRLLTEAVKYSLILTYDGPPKKKKVLEELRKLFAEAKQFILQREDLSVL